MSIPLTLLGSPNGSGGDPCIVYKVLSDPSEPFGPPILSGYWYYVSLSSFEFTVLNKSHLLPCRLLHSKFRSDLRALAELAI